MKFKNKCLKIMRSFGIAVFCCAMLSSCSAEETNQSIVLVKNAGMSSYGTGFAVGVEGEPVDVVVSAYSVIATQNNAPPKTAEIKSENGGNTMSADVLYYDVARNIAILKLPNETEDLKPLLLKENIDYDEKIYVMGYDGTGNIMTDYDDFNDTDIVRYGGMIAKSEETDLVKVYKYSKEFNRAAAGAPAVDEKGAGIGMCAYALDGMNTSSQYILSSEEIIKCLENENIDFMTYEELKYKNAIVLTIIAGTILLAAIAVFTYLMTKKRL